MLSEYQKLEQQTKALKEQMDSLPEGKLICSQNHGRYKWYQSDGRVKTYIPKQKHSLAKQLAVKKYLSIQMKECLEEKKAIQLYLKHHCKHPGEAEKLLSQDSGYRELLSDYFTPLDQNLSEWMNCPYPRNPSHPELLIHKSISGNLVRSKSESIIDMLLFLNKIPFRYECALQLKDFTVYPDFTIRHPATGQTYYWEHFGLMDHPDYCQNVCSKLQLYASCEIISSINLITTYETKKTPLDPELVKKIIAYYFS